jgi:hypothetical protein
MQTRKCPRCLQKKTISNFRKRSGADAVKRNRVGQPYGNCRSCENKRRGDTLRGSLGVLLQHARKRSRVKGVRCDLTTDQLIQLAHSQKSVCPLSGQPLTYETGHGVVYTNASIDRIKHDGDYTLSNVRLVCRVVNTMRSRLTDHQLYEWCLKVVENGLPD